MEKDNKKTIEIHRLSPFIDKANSEIHDWFAQANRAIGSYFKKGSKKAGSGLSFEEEVLLLPSVINLPDTDRDFRKQVENFYLDINTKVPQDGIKLEIGLQLSNDEPLSKENMPYNIEDFIKYRHAYHSPQVGLNKEDSEGNQLKMFYILDGEATSDKERKKIASKDEAMSLYLQMKDMPKKVKMLLTGLGKDPRSYKEEDLSGKLRELAESNPVAFVRIAKDENLEAKYQILSCINSGVLRKVGTSILVTESGERIGADMEETVIYWKEPKNSEQVNIARTRHVESSKLIKLK